MKKTKNKHSTLTWSADVLEWKREYDFPNKIRRFQSLLVIQIEDDYYINWKNAQIGKILIIFLKVASRICEYQLWDQAIRTRSGNITIEKKFIRDLFLIFSHQSTFQKGIFWDLSAIIQSGPRKCNPWSEMCI